MSIKFLILQLKSYRKYFLFSFLFSLLAASSIFIPYFSGKCISLAITFPVDYSALFTNLYYIFFLGLSTFVFLSLNSYLSSNLGYYLTRNLRMKVHQKLSKLPIKYFDSVSVGEITNHLINNIEVIGDGFIHALNISFFSLFTILGCITIMLIIDPILSIIVIVCTPIALLFSRKIAQRAYKRVKKSIEITADYASYSNEIVSSLRLIELYDGADKVLNKAGEISNLLKTTRARAMFNSSTVHPTTRFITNICYCVVGFVAGISYINNWYPLTISAISSMLLYGNNFFKPFNELTAIFAELQAMSASTLKVRQFLNETEEKNNSSQSIGLLSGESEFKDIYFSYDENTKLIEDFNLKVEAGQMIAIVGPTGSGKTTIINLLMQFYPPVSGDIIFDGKNSSLYSKESIRQNIGMVLQDNILFTGTIRENLLYGKEVDEEVFKKVVDLCELNLFIDKLENGYDQQINGETSYLSAGEKQLITIARALICDPTILILDEATSAVDIKTEQVISRALRRARADKTTFIIAHRLSTIIEADKIIVINEGKIVEIGTHYQLLENKGFYSQLYSKQFI